MGNLCGSKSVKSYNGPKRVVCIGGGHCNCQVVKLLKRFQHEGAVNIKLTLISEQEFSFYSGMLPGTVAGLYTEEELRVELAPLAAWCEADFVQKRVQKIVGKENKVYLQDGSVVDYDVLVINVGSKTRDSQNVEGVEEYGLTTRPINQMIGKIKTREQQLKEQGIIPKVVICGAGAAGTELSFAFKKRWSDYFGQEIEVVLLASEAVPLHDQSEQTKQQIQNQLKVKGIEVVPNARVQEIKEDRVILKDGSEIECNVAVWATGADPQKVSADSDLELLKGFFRVNNFMQSTTYKNVFAGGDCVTMESYVDKPYPTKAGVYAVRQGPIIAENVKNFIQGKPLVEYVPQTGFLSLVMTGDGNSIGSRNGISFYGEWVWKLKDYIDGSFMKLFDAHYLFKDYKKNGTKYPLPNFALFDDADEDQKAEIERLRNIANAMSPADAAQKLASSEEGDNQFQERWQILQRMTREEQFGKDVVEEYNVIFYQS